ncbi:hypothetical protein [Pontiella agarivorans]|uniref:Uncharacterized protein n=1 Tax=Pontiella agarivorans TaxID=3038953 RepID=A0ABU5MVW5_9BACT|nr:hypothetical protein [Pontiella agarivorans]MDZ8118358.1 hypothetical protein [Pontiella agarivorans]
MGRKEQQKNNSDFELSITRELKQRGNPFLRPIFAVAAIGALFMILASILNMAAEPGTDAAETPPVFRALEENHLTAHGECICIKCTLGLSDQHHRAIRYHSDGNEEKVILLRYNPNLNMNLDYFCNGPTPVLVEGTVLITNGLHFLSAQAFKAFPEERK